MFLVIIYGMILSMTLLFLSFDNAKVRAYYVLLQTFMMKKLLVDATLAYICDKTRVAPSVLSQKTI